MSWVEEFFDDPLYDLEYAVVLENAERTAAEADLIARELELGEKHRLLDLACGHGRHAVLLAPRVARLVGYDRTERFLEHARERAKELGLRNLELVRGDMRELAYEAEFDAAYNFFTAWGYYTDEEDLDVLVRVRKSLVPGGRFLLDFLNRDALMPRFQPRRWEELEDGTIVLTHSWIDYLDGRMHSRRTYQRAGATKEVDLTHLLPTPDELVRYLRRAGFTDIRIVSSPDGGEATITSRRVAVVGTAPR
jgi:SAM-dependent methyltransferase